MFEVNYRLFDCYALFSKITSLRNKALFVRWKDNLSLLICLFL